MAKKIVGRAVLAQMCGVTYQAIRWLEEKGAIKPKDIVVGRARYKEYDAKDVEKAKRCTSNK